VKDFTLKQPTTPKIVQKYIDTRNLGFGYEAFFESYVITGSPKVMAMNKSDDIV